VEKLGGPSPTSSRLRGVARRVAGILSLDSRQNVLILCCILLLAAMEFWPREEESRASRGRIDATSIGASGRGIALSGEWAP
jgi:hypothetical protein